MSKADPVPSKGASPLEPPRVEDLTQETYDDLRECLSDAMANLRRYEALMEESAAKIESLRTDVKRLSCRFFGHMGPLEHKANRCCS